MSISYITENWEFYEILEDLERNEESMSENEKIDMIIETNTYRSVFLSPPDVADVTYVGTGIR